jgi:predicted translin family RNA/ssDNA-binding protein
MIKIELRNASNGVIKTVIESQSNQEYSETVKVYEIYPEEKLESFLNIIQLLEDVTDDLGLETGSKFEPLQLHYDIDWGENYRPRIEEVGMKIKSLKRQLKHLAGLKKAITENANNV